MPSWALWAPPGLKTLERPENMLWSKLLDMGILKGTKMGTSNGEPQEYSRNIFGIYLPGSTYSYCIPTVFLRFPN